jgi:hypothetical protein
MTLQFIIHREPYPSARLTGELDTRNVIYRMNSSGGSSRRQVIVSRPTAGLLGHSLAAGRGVPVRKYCRTISASLIDALLYTAPSRCDALANNSAMLGIDAEPLYSICSGSPSLTKPLVPSRYQRFDATTHATILRRAIEV